MAHSLLRLAERALNRPLFLHPDKAAIIHDVLSGRIGTDPIGAAHLLGVQSNRLTAEEQYGLGDGVGLYVRQGTPIVPIVGSLVNRGSWIGADSGLVSYEGVQAMIAKAAEETKTGRIVLDIDSSGGEATGMIETAAAVRAVRDQGIEVIAIVNDVAASAAYGIASAANEIWVSPTSVVGSIGVVMLHLDRSGEMEKKGVRPTLIYAGAHKVDGHPYGPLTDGVRSDLNAEIQKFYGLFVDAVAAGRGSRLSADQARATEARVFIGEEAIKAGLADRIGSISSLIRNATKPGKSRGDGSQRRRASMPHDENAPAVTEAGISQADHDQAVAAARAAGASAERDRVRAILTADAAADRPVLALSLALETDLTAEAAVAVLGRQPAEQKAPALIVGGPEIGASATARGVPGPVAENPMKAAVARVNARFPGNR
jgi:capsid assembly protease